MYPMWMCRPSDGTGVTPEPIIIYQNAGGDYHDRPAPIRVRVLDVNKSVDEISDINSLEVSAEFIGVDND